jgi:hypothetical protein
MGNVKRELFKRRINHESSIRNRNSYSIGVDGLCVMDHTADYEYD